MAFLEQLSRFASSHALLVLLAFGLLAAILVVELLIKRTSADALSPEQVTALVNRDSAILIDLREKDAYLDGHIVHAKHCVPKQLTLQRINDLGEGVVVFIDADGRESSVMANSLSEETSDRTFVYLGGGMRAWSASGLPVVKS